MVNFLLDRDAKIDELGFVYCVGSGDKMDNAGSALHLTVTQGHLETVTSLLDRGATIDLKDEQQRTALDIARKKDKNNIISLLQERGAAE
jgi:ankyrin repeat protein